MIVMKFGGTSLGDGSKVRAVIELVRERLDEKPVLVVSAHAGVTNLLDDLAKQALGGVTGIEPIREAHGAILADLGLEADLLDEILDELESLLTGVTLVKELTPRSLDYVHSFGERLSSMVVAAAFRQAEIPAKSLLAWDLGLKTDSSYGCAHPLKESWPNIRKALTKIAALPMVGHCPSPV